MTDTTWATATTTYTTATTPVPLRATLIEAPLTAWGRRFTLPRAGSRPRAR